MYIQGINYVEFVSVNGLKMVEGKWLNWQIRPLYRDSNIPFIFSVAFGTLSEMWLSNYYWEADKLYISKLGTFPGESVEFHVTSLEMAEMITLSSIKGKGLEILSLYDKDLNSWN